MVKGAAAGGDIGYGSKARYVQAALVMIFLACAATPVVGTSRHLLQDSLMYSARLDSIVPPWADSYDARTAKIPNHAKSATTSYYSSVGEGIELSVCFARSSNKSDEVCVTEPGQLLDLHLTAVRPRVTVAGPGLSAHDAYTLLIVDPDAFNPTHPVARSVVHWIISNIPGSILPSQDDSELGTTVMNYLHPQKPTALAPPPYGVHRYYNLLFQQARPNQNIPNVTTPLLFSTRKFTRANQLGDFPVAGSMFTIDIDA